MEFIFDFIVSHDGGVILILFLVHFLFLLELSEGLHFFRRFGDDGGEIDFFSFGFLFESRKLFHELIVLMSFFDQIISIRSEQPVYFYNSDVNTLLDGYEFLSGEKFLYDSGDKVDEGLEEELVFVYRFAGIVQKNLCVEIALNYD